MGKSEHREVDREAFEAAYRERILDNAFFEGRAYYERSKQRYRRTLEHVASLPLPRRARVLEIGGGQIALLAAALFGDECIVADISEADAQSVRRFGLGFQPYNLLSGSTQALQEHAPFDLIVLCEVIEHLPVPPHVTLRPLTGLLSNRGHLLLTTPNLHRLRNFVRMAGGREFLDPWFFPGEGHSIGHVIEYSAAQLEWQLRMSGLRQTRVERRQLVNEGFNWRTRLLRKLAAPLMLRPTWRDSLIAWGQRDGEQLNPSHQHPPAHLKLTESEAA